jgi:hypothetical protein
MDEHKDNPGKKMRALLGQESPSALDRLPKKENTGTINEKILPELKKSEAQSPMPKPASHPKGKNLQFAPAFWTIASALSLTINIIFTIILLALFLNIKNLNPEVALNPGNFLLGGLHNNFEKMDSAHITTTIPIETNIPVKFDLQLNQQTQVILSEDVTITNALVTVKTGGMNIANALTTIVLPQGTTLPVMLNLTVPVDQMVPVELNVNVDIPLAQTELHKPFKGLQDVVKPFYCMVNANALNLEDQPICK